MFVENLLDSRNGCKLSCLEKVCVLVLASNKTLGFAVGVRLRGLVPPKSEWQKDHTYPLTQK